MTPREKRVRPKRPPPLLAGWQTFLLPLFEQDCGKPWSCLFYTTMAGNNRPDKNGTHRGAFERNKRIIYSTQSKCGICGMPVDFGVKYPHPLSPCIDHIIPIAKGGHPSDMDNLQLAHWICNRQKSDKLVIRKEEQQKEDVGNYALPWSLDWEQYRA